MHRTPATGLSAILLVIGLLLGASLKAQVPTVLSDKIHKGSGTIDLLKDLSAVELQSYLNANGGLLLGVDLNENAGGNESRDSIGVAIKQLELVITTSAGTVSFSDFYTGTTARITEAGAASAQEYATLLGKIGSSQINGATKDFDLGAFDDVVRLQNVSVQGDILSAKLKVTFVQTARTGQEGNETFFDYSGGFEDFVLLGQRDAGLLEAANFGTTGLDSSVAVRTTTTNPSAPGAPLPPLSLLLALGAVVAWKARRTDTHGQR